mgnify:CR=1 FL=1
MTEARPQAVPTILLDDDVVRITRWDFAPASMSTAWAMLSCR